MFKISFINMPFAALTSPSLALTQLKYIVEKRFGDKVKVNIFYLNQDFAHYLGMDLYQEITGGLDAYTSGVGDWLFRQEAFPELPDNTEAYFKRYLPNQDSRGQFIKRLIREKRLGLHNFLEKLIDQYGLDESNLVGFTSMFTQNVASFAMAKKLKDRNSEIITTMGGANCEAPMGQVIAKNARQIDYVFSGPALISFPKFVENCLDQTHSENQFIKGVFSKKNLSLPQLECGSGLGEELSIDVKIELDYRSFLDAVRTNFPNNSVKPFLLFETSRGCWWGEKAHCTFCGLNGGTMAYRSMAPENALALINSLFKYAEECSRLECVDNILPRNYIKDVLAHLNTPPNMSIFYEVKADLSEEDIQVLAKAQVSLIQPGIESLATSTLKLMKKGTNVFQNLGLLKNCVAYGILPGWNLLVGFPGEDEDVYQKYVADIPRLTHLPPPSGVYPVRFDRYSPYFVKAKQYGLNLAPLDYYSLIYPFDEDAMTSFAYHFADRNLKADYFLKMVKWIGKVREKHNKWLSLWSVKGRFHPKLFLKTDGKSTSVFDSRSGEAVEYSISSAGVQVLEQLNKPRRIHDLAQSLSHIPHFDADEEVAWLNERGLVFHEGERYMSLVFMKAPPTMELSKLE